MAPRPLAPRAVRLPVGKYAYRGRAVPFAKLPKREKARFRSVWARKGRATKKRAVKAAPKVKAFERRKLRGEMKRRGLRVFAAERGEGVKLKDAVSAVYDLARDEFPHASRGSWLAVYEWPDDERSTRGRTWQSRVSRPFTDKLPSGARYARDWFEEVEEYPQALGPLGDLHPSRGYGKGRVTELHYMTFAVVERRGRGKRERKRKPVRR